MTTPQAAPRGRPLSTDPKIIIVGAGVFGLSTALHLVQRGYSNVHVFDAQALEQSQYGVAGGAHGASSDENKILRASYGGQTHYQALAFRAIAAWQRWNGELAAYADEEDLQDSSSDSNNKNDNDNKKSDAAAARRLPSSLSPRTPLWHNCGFLRLTDRQPRGQLAPSEAATQRSFPPALAHTQFRVTSAEAWRRAAREGIPASKLDPFGVVAAPDEGEEGEKKKKKEEEEKKQTKTVDGILDMTAGFVLASRACAWALHLLRRSGKVTLHLGAEHALQSLIVEPSSSSSPSQSQSSSSWSSSSSPPRRVTGITTASGARHTGDMVVVATGAWTPALLPETAELLETTAGSVVTIHVPADRTELARKYSPANCPVFSWNYGDYRAAAARPDNSFFAEKEEGEEEGRDDLPAGEAIGDIYGIPLTPPPADGAGDAARGRATASASAGVVKFGFRGAKWTSYTHAATATATAPGQPQRISYPDLRADGLPATAMRALREFVATHCADLLALPPACVDFRLCWYTDSVDNSFLISRVPAYENVVVASGGSGHGFKFLPVLGEHVVDVMEGKETEYTRLFAWRPSGKGTGRARNGLEEGEGGWRDLSRQRMVGKEEGWSSKGSKL